MYLGQKLSRVVYFEMALLVGATEEDDREDLSTRSVALA
jgi:hypothetical protein